MPDLHARFRSLDRVPAPGLWPEVELRVAQPLDVDRDRTARLVPWVAVGAAMALVVGLAAVLLVWPPSDPSVGVGPSSSEGAPTSTPRPFGDPRYMNADRDAWTVIDEWESLNGSQVLRAAWVEGAFCYDYRLLYSDGLLRSGLGGCVDPEELDDNVVVSASVADNLVDDMIFGMVPSEDVVRVEVMLESGEVIEASLPRLVVPGRPAVGVFHAAALNVDAVTVRAFDASGRELFSWRVTVP